MQLFFQIVQRYSYTNYLVEIIPLHQRVAAVTESKWFVNIFLGLILLNAILIGMESVDFFAARYSPQLMFLDQLFVILFVLEISVKIFA
jgi:voltage-gated sodium channel